MGKEEDEQIYHPYFIYTFPFLEENKFGFLTIDGKPIIRNVSGVSYDFLEERTQKEISRQCKKVLAED